ncbi:TetR/AcrR family transcriptional regulator [Anaerophaga thermohalophila]|uniref:TetR/AcrR family transcriptional regulator n=1 Tax=Anaerophaga thermohalophila TaxID=177400 RepID=UPI000237C888|nr:TetR family transcriptional regulator [Anaerophaga thermohalophila]
MENRGLDIERIANLYYKFGVKNITMDEIANELGISKRTIYQQVATKYELVQMVLNEEFDKFKEAVLKVVSENRGGIQKLYGLYSVVLMHFKPITPVFVYSLVKMSSVLADNIREQYGSFIKETLSQIIEEGKNEGVFLTRFKDDFATLFTGFLFQTGDIYVDGKERNVDLNNMFYLQISGICTAKGEKILEQFIENPQILSA